MEAQTLLTQLGYNPGPIDGLYGGKTRRAIEAFQREQGLVPDGQTSYELIASLQLAASKALSAIVFTLDGIDLLTSLTGIKETRPGGSTISYLEPRIEEVWQLPENDVHSLPWTGRTADTALAVEQAKGFITLLVRKASNDQKPFVIVGHSWGSVLAYRALVELSKEGKIKQGDIDQLITFGSPLFEEIRTVRQFARRKARWIDAAPASLTVPKWQNFYTEDDCLGGGVSEAGVDQHELPTPETSCGNAHNAYHEDALLLRKIGKELRVALAPPTPQVATALTSGSPDSTQPQPSVTQQPLYGQKTVSPTQTPLTTEHTSAATPTCAVERSKHAPETKTSGDYERGLELFQQADYAGAYKIWLPLAKNGDARAQTMIGELYKNSWGVAFNVREAERWHLMAAEQGYPEGQYNLGNLYVEGWGIKDCNKGMAWLRKAANQGYSRAQLLLAYIYDSGQNSQWMCVPRNAVETYMWASLAAASDDSEIAQRAQGFLGNSELSGRMTPTQIAQAKEKARLLQQKIAQTQTVQAQGAPSPGQSDFYWGMTAYNSKDYGTAFQIFEPLAYAGGACAQHMLGFFYDKGFGVSAVEVKAREWYQKAAAQGDAEAAQRLAVLNRRQMISAAPSSVSPAPVRLVKGNILVSFRTMEELPDGCRTEIKITDKTNRGIKRMYIPTGIIEHGPGHERTLGNPWFHFKNNVTVRKTRVGSTCKGIQALIFKKLWREPRNPDYKGGYIPLYNCQFYSRRSGKGLECGQFGVDPRSPLPVRFDGIVPQTAEQAPPSQQAALPTQPTPRTLAHYGLTLSEITPALRHQFQFNEDVEGVVVTNVREGSEADQRQIASWRPGVVIMEVDQQEVNTPQEVADLIQTAIDDERVCFSILLVGHMEGTVFTFQNAPLYYHSGWTTRTECPLPPWLR